MTEKFRLSISIQKRILLHLLEHIDTRDSFEVTPAVTQQGIADAIGIRLEHVSRSITKLIPEGYVFVRSSHVRSEYRRKKAYFLTTKGMSYINEIKNEYKTKKLLVRTLEGELREIKYSELENHLNFKMKLLDVYRYISTSDKGIINLKQLISDRERADQIGLLDRQSLDTRTRDGFRFSSNIPKVDIFFGRESELKKLNDLLSSSVNIINIQGIAGIGKTTLISQFITKLEPKTNIFWYQFELWSSLKDVIEAISDFLNKLGKNELYLYLRNNPSFDLGQVIRIMTLELEELDLIMVFDDFQRSDKQTQDFFLTLKNLGKNIRIPKLIIISRSRPKFYDKRDVSIDKIVGEMRLSGLDLENSKKILLGTGLDDERFEQIYDLSKGHPVALRLISSIDSVSDQSDFRSFIEDEIFNDLDLAEKQLLNKLCVYRYPVPPTGLFGEESAANYDILSGLEKRFLIIKTRFDSYQMNEVLVDIYYSRLTPDEKKLHHQYAADYYASSKNDIGLMERIYHLIHSDHYKQAAMVSIEYGERIISRGYFEYHLLLEKFTKEKISKALYQEILALKSDALARIGAWDKVLHEYETQLDGLPKKQSKEAKAQLYSQIGEVYNRMGDLDKTLKYYLDSLELFEKKNNKKEIARVSNNLGLIYRQRSEYKKSLKMYKRSLQIFQSLSDPIGVTTAYLNLGKTYEYLGEPKTAVKCYNKGLKNSVDSDYNTGIAISNKFLGLYYLSIDDLQKAEKYLRESLECFRKERRNEDLIFICETLSGIHYDKEEFDSAIEILLVGAQHLEQQLAHEDGASKLGLFRRLRLRRLRNRSSAAFETGMDLADSNGSLELLRCYERIGNIYRELGRYNDAIKYHKKQLTLALDQDNNHEAAKGFLNLGIDHKKTESFDEALNSYSLALEQLTIIDDPLGQSLVNRNLGKLYELTGEAKKALEYYETSLEQSKASQYDLGITKALKAIGKLYIKQGDKRKGNMYLKKGMRLADNMKHGIT